jgi:hypothetical protein
VFHSWFVLNTCSPLLLRAWCSATAAALGAELCEVAGAVGRYITSSPFLERFRNQCFFSGCARSAPAWRRRKQQAAGAPELGVEQGSGERKHKQWVAQSGRQESVVFAPKQWVNACDFVRVPHRRGQGACAKAHAGLRYCTHQRVQSDQVPSGRVDQGDTLGEGRAATGA